jgi:hypothetical protein
MANQAGIWSNGKLGCAGVGRGLGGGEAGERGRSAG